VSEGERLPSARPMFWLVSVAALLAVAATLMLGYWQLTRAWSKEALAAAIEAQSRLSPLGNPALTEPGVATTLLHRPVRLSGTWSTAHTVFLDNRQMDAKPGFYVLTPLRLQGTEAVVLVQRGWVQRNFQDRSRLPSVPSASGLVDVEGRIEAPPSKLFDLGDDGKGAIRQNLDLAAFARETGLALLPVSVVQTGGSDAATDGLLRHWPVPVLGAGKNYGYAFQWFALSALITALYGWFQFGKKHVAQRKS
jgi:surfeit locus 1 family protein